MNKKEVSEIKRQFKMSNKYLSIEKISAIYVKNKNIDIIKTKRFVDTEDFNNGVADENCWNETEEICFLDIIKKTLTGGVGKILTEYSFPNSVLLDKKSNYVKLNNVLNSFNDSSLKEYANLIVNSISLDDDYTIIISKCSYSVPQKDVNGDKMDDEFYDGDVYNFLTLSICPVQNSKPSISINSVKKDICKDSTNKNITAPVLGFIYPTFNERMTDVNTILVFDKKPKTPCMTLVEDVLECNYQLGPEEEQNRFNMLLLKIASDDNKTIDYEISKNIHQNISDIIEKSSVNTETVEFNKAEIKKILVDSGISTEKLDDFDDIYKEIIDNYKLKAVNIVNSNLNIKTPDIVINVKNNSTDKVVSKTIDGNKCLVIELNENVKINGLDVNV